MGAGQLNINWTDDILSSLIGTVMAIIVISLLGGKIATAWADRQFNRKWHNYREIAANEIEANFKASYNQTMIYFGGYLKHIAEKPESDISTVDYDLFIQRRDELMNGMKFIDRIFESYHFCLRETDIKRGLHFMIAAKRDIKEIDDGISQSLKNFESMLSTHLQGRYPLSERVEPFNCTRHEFMLGCGIAIEKFLQARRPTDLLNRLSIFTSGLRKPGAAKLDERERIWLAQPLPTVIKETA